MSFDAQRHYNLLPAVHRVRDVEQGEPLRALLSIIADQVAILEKDLEQLYDNQFVETCAPWVLPYIGDLIGVRGLHGVGQLTRTPRAEVAHTIGYRRRKGTAAMLELLARDAASLLVPGGMMLIATNYQKWSREAFLGKVRKALQPRKFVLKSIPLPPDFPYRTGEPLWMKSVWATLQG